MDPPIYYKYAFNFETAFIWKYSELSKEKLNPGSVGLKMLSHKRMEGGGRQIYMKYLVNQLWKKIQVKSPIVTCRRQALSAVINLAASTGLFSFHLCFFIQVDGDAEDWQVLEELKRCLKREIEIAGDNGGGSDIATQQQGNQKYTF